MKAYDAGDFRVEPRWKEQVIYWEGARGYIFDAACGVDPGQLFVPAAEDWDTVAPNWMHARREEILGRLREHSYHEVVEEVPAGGHLASWRLLTQ